MRAISLWQPWASLIAVGAKRVETRDWPAPQWILGEQIAIHAAKTRDWLALCEEEPFSKYVTAADCPLGAIVATAVIDRTAQMTRESQAALEDRNSDEFEFGNYSPGRWAWVLRDVKPLDEPIPFRGMQRFFLVPDELLGAVVPYVQESLAL